MIYGDIIAIGNLDVRHLNQPGKIVVETPLAAPSSLIAMGAGAGAALAAPGVVATRTIAIGDGALALALAASADNIAIGTGAGAALVGGDGNVLIGTSAGGTLTAGDNVFIGLNAGATSTLQQEAVHIGVSAGALAGQVFGGDVLIGARAGNHANTLGLVAVGWEAGATSGGNHSVLIGEGAGGYFATAPLDCVMIGWGVGIGVGNAPARAIYIGTEASYDGGDGSVLVGYRAGYNLTIASHSNVFLGHQAGLSTTDSPYNIVIGSVAAGSTRVGPVNSATGFNVVIGTYAAALGQTLAETPAAGAEYVVIAGGQSIAVADPLLRNLHFGSLKPGNWRTASGADNSALGDSALDALTTGARNHARGTGALGTLTTGTDNIAIGHNAMLGAAGGEAPLRNVVLGAQALDAYAAAAADNVVLGYQAATAVTNLQTSIVIGTNALDAATGGGVVRSTIIGYNAAGSAATAAPIDGVIIGYQAALATTTALGLTAIGSGAFPAGTTGDYNIAIGFGANPIGTTGTYNVVIGAYVAGTAEAATLPSAGVGGHIVIAAHTLGEATGDQIVVVTPGNVYIGADRPGNWLTSTGGDNVAVGRIALGSVTDGENNTVIGAGCGTSITTGDGNILIGNPAHIADTPAVDTIDHLNIGAVIFGDLATPAIRIGGVGTVTGQIALLALESGNDDDEEIFSLETTGANGAAINTHVGTEDPNGVVSSLNGSLYVRADQLNSALYQNVSAAAAGTDWVSIGGAFYTQAEIPIETDDSADGYKPGDVIYSTAAQSSYTCVDATAGAAIWIRQRSPAGRRIRLLEPSAGAAVQVTGWTSATAGTVTTPAPATTNLRTSLHRAELTSAGAANSAASVVAGTNGGGAAAAFLRGGGAPQGGFYLDFTFAAASVTANQRCFFGLLASVVAFSGTQDPDALTDCYGVGWRSADGNLQVFVNDAAGTVTAVDLGANFPANSTDAVYQVILYAPASSGTLYYVVRRLDAAFVAEGNVAANLPTATTFMLYQAGINNGGTAAAAAFNLMHVYTEG